MIVIILLKKCRNALAPPLAKIWRKSMLNGEIPDICKSATIIPIHKGKSRAVPKNYRPVALTSHLIKIFEKVVRKQIVDFMQANDLFNYSQHGFRGGRSCLSQLLCHFDRITSELENGKGVDVVYLDFAKAFDKVDHGITLRKLKLLGIKGQLGRWICSFLTNRVQSVLVEGKKSKPKPVTSGVPQGSVLGPLLFLVLIGDIDKTVASSFLSSFADDTRVGKGIASEEDIHNLQADLEAIYKWSVDNNMTFNSDKFELLRYKSKSSKELQASTSYSSDNGSIIEEKLHVRDLGVTLSNTATFSQHIHEKCIAVKSKISWVLRTFKTRESLPMLTLWKTQIMCHLDYCSQLWSPKKNRRHSILRTAPESFCKEHQRNVCSFILGSTYQVEALFPGTAPRTLPSHLYLEDYRGTCSKFWLHPHPVIQELKAWSRVQSSPHLLQCSLCYTDNQVFCSPCQGAPPVQCITQELAEYVWLHYWEVQVRTGPLLGYCTRWAPGARPHPVPEMWQQLSDRLGKFSIPASTGQPAPATQLPGARWGGHNVTTRWIPQTLPSDTEW